MLACADLEVTRRLEAVLAQTELMQLCGRASTGGELLAQFRAQRPDLVVIAGDIDGCHGVRIAGTVGRERAVPIVLLVEPGAQDEARDELEARGVAAHVVTAACLGGSDETSASVLRTTLQLLASRVAPNPESEPLAVRPHLPPVAREGFDAVVLVGSAGTPHMLPELLAARPRSAVPLVVAVHHNPRMSDAFCSWVGELVGQCPEPLCPERYVGELYPLHVAEASARGGDGGLEPDLGAVVDSVVAVDRRVLVCVASGMGLTGLDAVRRVRTCGGVVLALDPSCCSQPAMSAAVVGAGLADHVVTLPELAWMIAHASHRRHTEAGSFAHHHRLAASM